MKKVLITSNLYLPNIGGIENSLYYLAKAGIENGDKITIVSSDIVDTDDINIDREELDCDIIKYEVPKNKSKFIKFIVHLYNAFKTYRKIKNEGCDIVISRYHLNTLLCYLVGLKNIHYIVPGVVKYQNAVHNISTKPSSILNVLKYKINCAIQYFAFKVSDKIFVFSDSMKKQVNGVFPTAKIKITSPGIDLIKFRYIEKKEEDKVNLLTVSRINGAKNISMAIESLIYLPDKFHLTIIGDGPLLNDLKELTKELKLEERVEFTGAQNNVVPYYDKAHIFLLPSIYEPFGQTLLEASSCGIPTVAFHSDIVDTATVPILGDYACYAGKLNSVSYAEEIKIAYSSYYKIEKRIKKELRNFICQKYSWEKLYVFTTEKE